MGPGPCLKKGSCGGPSGVRGKNISVSEMITHGKATRRHVRRIELVLVAGALVLGAATGLRSSPSPSKLPARETLATVSPSKGGRGKQAPTIMAFWNAHHGIFSGDLET